MLIKVYNFLYLSLYFQKFITGFEFDLFVFVSLEEKQTNKKIDDETNVQI